MSITLTNNTSMVDIFKLLKIDLSELNKNLIYYTNGEKTAKAAICLTVTSYQKEAK